MPKRKAIELASHPPGARRQTRSSMSGPLVEAKVASPRVAKGHNLKAIDRKESKENDGSHSEDDMNLISPPPSKRKASRFSTPTSPSKGSPRLLIEAVEIRSPLKVPQINLSGIPETPTRLPRTIQIRTSSPSPSRRVHFAPQSSKNLGSSSPTPSVILPPTYSSPSNQPIASEHLPRFLPSHLIPHLHLQKQAILCALQYPPLVEYDSCPYPVVSAQLEELVKGTIERHEGNSCLVLGPKGSGKNRLVDYVLTSIPSTSKNPPVIVRLSAYCQTNDRLAMREIARQINEQLGISAVLHHTMKEGSSDVNEDAIDIDFPPSSHLPGMMAALPGLGRPIIVVLDAFDGFTAHARQALLYCLFDTVQSCRGGAAPVIPDQQLENPFTDDTENDDFPQTLDSHQEVQDVPDIEKNKVMPDVTKGEHGLLVIGITSRVDCLTLLEKRVKSRFSHRIMRVGTPPRFQDFLRVLKVVLTHESSSSKANGEWRSLWRSSVKEFLDDKETLNVIKETFAFGKDLRALLRLMISPIISLTPSSPWLKSSQLVTSASVQRCPRQFPCLDTLPYPHIALLIAAAHSKTAGHDTFNFEMLHDRFMAQVRVSIAAPVQFERGGLSMVNVGRGVMMGAFEDLIANHIFRAVAAPSTHVTKEFTKYRCIAPREDIRNAVERLGHTNLKKWFSKPQ